MIPQSNIKEINALVKEAFEKIQVNPDVEHAFLIVEEDSKYKLIYLQEGTANNVDFNGNEYIKALRNNKLRYLLHSHPAMLPHTASKEDIEQASLSV